MSRVVEWVRHNWLVLGVIAVVSVFLGWRQQGGIRPLQYATRSFSVTSNSGGVSVGKAVSGVAMAPMMAEDSAVGIAPMPQIVDEVAPTMASDRLVLRDTFMSMQVKDVRKAADQIQAKVVELGGFLVDENVNMPEGAASGNITVRVPEEKRVEALEAFRALGVKVVSETVSGRDVTDQYEDIAAKLAVLNTTKAKFEEIMGQASKIQDLLQVQRELVSLQQQIDSLKGRQQYLEQSAKLTRISVYLSTDELALPYAPDQAWRPQVVFKQAVRSLIGSARQGANGVIWLTVYAPIWLPVLIIGWWLARRNKKV